NNKGEADFSVTFGSKPQTEPGLWQTPDDWDNFRDIYGLTRETPVLSLLRTNDNGLLTAGITGTADDRDAIAYYLSAAITFNKHKDDSSDLANVTIADLNSANYPQKYDQEISDTEDAIFGQIQK